MKTLANGWSQLRLHTRLYTVGPTVTAVAIVRIAV